MKVGVQHVKGRILYVEDHLDTYDAISILLEFSGYAVTPAHTFADGLRLATSEGFDLFILDYNLEGGNGCDLCRRIRAFDPRTPIILFSVTRGMDEQKVMAVGAQDYVPKLAGFDKLERAISRLLNP